MILAVLALVGSALASDIKHPNFAAKGGTVLGLSSFTAGLGAVRSSAEPSFQAINTGTGNAFEAHVNTAGKGVVVSYQGASPSSGLESGGDPGLAYLAARSPAGFVELFGNDWSGGGSDFVGGTIVLGGDRGLRGLYGDRGWGKIRWQDAFGGMFVFSTLRKGQNFGFSSGASAAIESFFQVANGYAVWAFSARSSNVPAVVSYSWGCSTNNRPTHSEWTDSAGNKLLALMDAGSGVGNLRSPAGSISASVGFLPLADNTGSVGSGSLRFATVRAVTVTTGDLGFEDECCPVCGACFETGEDVVWRIRRQEREKGGKILSRAVPIHVGCSK